MEGDAAVQRFMKSMQAADELKIQLATADAADVATEGQAGAGAGSGDWTSSYSAWEQWNVRCATPALSRHTQGMHLKGTTQATEMQKDDLRQRASQADAEARRAMKRMPFGCNSDHSDEQRLFDMSPPRLIAACVRFKNVGNLLFREGQYGRARERYRKALVYYEYCFPDDQRLQGQLDAIRFLCLLNMAACQVKLRAHREALSALHQALALRPDSAKALYRRAVVWRHLDEYGAAAADLVAAGKLAPTSPDIRREALALANQRKAYVRQARRVATAMLGRGQGGEVAESEAEETGGQPEVPDWASVTTAGSEVDLESTGADGVSLGDGEGVDLEEEGSGGFTTTEALLRLPLEELPGRPLPKAPSAAAPDGAPL